VEQGGYSCVNNRARRDPHDAKWCVIGRLYAKCCVELHHGPANVVIVNTVLVFRQLLCIEPLSMLVDAHGWHVALESPGRVQSLLHVRSDGSKADDIHVISQSH
jgi:hypothetical protein